jgi:hypothetical protein
MDRRRMNKGKIDERLVHLVRVTEIVSSFVDISVVVSFRGKQCNPCRHTDSIDEL